MSNLEYDHEDPTEAVMLEDARKIAGPIQIAVCYLVRADGTASPVYYCPEFGDGDGTQGVRDVAKRSLPYLRQGESVIVIVSEFVPRGN